jgi:hypothetical protein
MCDLGPGIIIGSAPGRKAVHERHCRRWECDECGPSKAAALRARARAGSPNRFVTLTCRTWRAETIPERADLLLKAWQRYRLWWRRENQCAKFEYVAVWEVGKKENVHLHILVRGPWLEQKQLSDFFGNEIDSPVVHVRAVRSVARAAKYAFKYITKDLIKIAGRHRYMFSHDYEPDASEFTPAAFFKEMSWDTSREKFAVAVQRCISEGYSHDCDFKRGRARFWWPWLPPP